MQIIAQLDDDYAEKFNQLQNNKGLNQLQILKIALDSYFAKELTETDNKGSLHDLLASDFVGCGEGPEDGSVNYKSYVSDYLNEKYANHS